MPRAIAPEVTTTTSTPAACSAATSSQIRATTDSRSAPVSSATIDEPSLTTATGRPEPTRDPARRRCRRSRRRRRARTRRAPARRSRPCAAGGARRAPAPPRSRGPSAAISRSTESPVTIQPPSGPRVMSNACDLAGRKTANSATSSSPEPSGSGSATGTRSQQLAAQLVQARAASRSRSRAPGRRRARATPTAAAAATSGGTRSAFDSASSRGSAGEPRVVLGQLALDHLEVALRVRAVQRREIQHVHQQPRALDVREEVVAEPGAVARRPRSAPGCRRARAGGRRRRSCPAPAAAS